MPNVDSQRLFSKLSAIPLGVDLGTDPSLLGDNQVALATNLSLRGDLATTRSPYSSIPLDAELSGVFQGACVYETPSFQAILVMVSGRIYSIEVTPTDLGKVRDVTPSMPIVTTADFTVPAPAATVMVSVASETPFAVGDTIFIDSGEYTVTNRFTNALLLTYVGSAANATVSAGASVLDSTGTQVTQDETYPTTLDFVHIFQAEKYAIVLGLQQRPLIFDGTMTRLAGVTEVPSGVLGLYAWGRLWIVLPDLRSFVAGDIVYGPSGTPAQGFVDAILSFTENDFLNEGGFFGVPNNAGPITVMLALATIDTSLGIGPILVGTANSVVSVNAPVDRTTWKNLTYPIQTISLLDYGPLGPNSTISINNDVWYRAVDGIRSFLIARRSTAGWGNTPQSHEISPVLAEDTEELLRFGSSILFDNRALFTLAPRRTSSGIVHDGLAVINFDSLSTIQGKQPPVWEGFQSGLSVLRLLRGRIRGVERAFAFALNETTSAIELWELLPENGGYYDTYRAVSGADTTIVRTSIGSALETKRYEYERLVKLILAELYLDDVVDNVTLVIKFKPDEYPSWVTWATISLCATVSQCSIATPDEFSCTIWRPNARTYAARIRLPRPPEECNTLAGIPLDRGYSFQFRIEGTGHFRLRKFRPHLRIQTDAQEGECPTQAVCATFPQCPEAIFDYRVSREVLT